MLDRNLTPIENIFQDAEKLHKFVYSYRSFVTQGGDSKQLHKAKLGEQTCTWLGAEFRFWVWEFPEYRVMVSKRGLEFDVAPNCSAKKAWELWRGYCESLGIKP